MEQDTVLLNARNAEEFFLFLEKKGRKKGTIENYRRSLKNLYSYLQKEEDGSGKYISIGMLMQWRDDMLHRGYAVRTVNARMSAVNMFLEYSSRRDLQIAPMSVKKEWIQPELSRAEYRRLLNAAKKTEQERTYFLLKTIAVVGVRMDELEKITVENLREGRITVADGQKKRTVRRIPMLLCEELLDYAERRGIGSGAVFLTKKGTPINRKHAYQSFKQLCQDAGIGEEKVTPGCLRSLYYRTYEVIENSIAVLTEQAYERMLEEEQETVGWRKRS